MIITLQLLMMHINKKKENIYNSHKQLSTVTINEIACKFGSIQKNKSGNFPYYNVSPIELMFIIIHQIESFIYKKEFVHYY